MPDYRLYCLNGEGHIGLADWIEADNDDEAVTLAYKLRPEAHKCEVWCEGRLVAKLNENGSFERTVP